MSIRTLPLFCLSLLVLFHPFLAHAEKVNANDAFMTGMGFELSRDYQEATRWYRIAAEQGHVTAQTSLGDICLNGGEGFDPDATEALRWYLLAAENGDEGAQVSAGMIFAEGVGTPQDYQSARRWFQEAANQGSAAGMFNLGIIHDHGYGVPADRISAFSWYRMAAVKGNADAQFNTGIMYARGDGTGQDAVEAYRWIGKAAEQGHAKATAARFELERIMTPAQLALARGDSPVYDPSGPTIAIPDFKPIPAPSE